MAQNDKADNPNFAGQLVSSQTNNGVNNTDSDAEQAHTRGSIV
jgi:hypothetical protein